MEGSASRAEPSTLKPETVEGSIPQGRTLHENTAHHGRFNVQSGTIRAEARNRGRFHSPSPNPPRKSPASWKVQHPEWNHPRLSPNSWTAPFSSPVNSIYRLAWNLPLAPLGRILLLSARYFPTKSRRPLQHSSPLLLQGRWTIRPCPGHCR